MVGKKGAWERDGTRITRGQIVAGAFIAGIVLIAALLLLVRLVISLATA